MGKFKGVLYGMATSVTFGLIPLFTLPLLPLSVRVAGAGFGDARQEGILPYHAG